MKLPEVTSTIREVVPNSPAEKYGLKAGDKILEISNYKIKKWSDIVLALQKDNLAKKEIIFLRDEERKKTIVTATLHNKNNRNSWFLGIAPTINKDNFKFIRKGVWDSLNYGFEKTIVVVGLTITSIYKIFAGSISLDNLSGPISIVEVAGKTLSFGASSFIGFMAFLSISLGIFNLLPIPLLDGGQFILYSVESIVRRRLSEMTHKVILYLGLVAFASFAFIAFSNDLTRVFGL
jgi:regulator of sigma E protease